MLADNSKLFLNFPSRWHLDSFYRKFSREKDLRLVTVRKEEEAK